jgi:hypothetical protein
VSSDGIMVPKPTRTAQSLKKKGIPQLAVPQLRVKKSQTFEINPCQDLMSAMLGRFKISKHYKFNGC